MMRRWIIFGAILLAVWAFPAQAQDNLLTNGGLEQGTFGPYQGKGRADLNVPVGWDIWLGQGSTDQFFNRGDKVFSFPHPGPAPAPVEGGTAANLSGGFVQFNAAYFQTVSVAPDTNLRAEVTSQIKVCNLPEDGAFCGSDTSSGGRTRIGIDPNGGSDPNAGEIVWSAWTEPHDRWAPQAVEATSTAGQVTVFLYVTQGGVYDINTAYFDDAKLTAEGGGGAAGEGGEAAAPPPTPVPQFVPFVNPQDVREDGSIIHVVSEGDTLDSIAVAYGLTRQDIIDRNPNLGSIRFLRIGQEITIREPQVDEREPATRGGNDPDATPIPGGVATEEPTEDAGDDPDATEEAASATEEADGEDVVLNPDPKGLEAEPTTAVTMADDPEEAENLLDAVSGLFGNGGEDGDTADDVTEEEAADAGDDATPEVTEEAAADAGDEATPEVTEEAAEPTTVAAAPTPVAEAPVVEAESVPAVDIAASTVAVCVSLFEDVNQNRLRESGENLLPGGTVNLSSGGADVGSYDTNGQSEPYCFTDLEAGEYVAVASAPEGYGLTTPNQLRLPLTAGASLNIEFGAAVGVEAPAIPPDTGADLGNSADVVLPAEGTSLTDNIFAISGIIVAVLAGVVVLAGIGAAVLLRRAR